MRTITFLACAALVGCSRSDKNVTEEPPGTTTITSAPVTLAGPSDDELIRRAETAVASDFDLSESAGNVEIDVIEGIATLRGAAPDAQTLREIEDSVSRVPGIVTTLNKAVVRTPTPEETDDTIAFSLQRAFITDPVVADVAERVTIDVHNGKVTLRGSVPYEQARAAFERITTWTPGVTDVKSELKVSPDL